MKNILKTKINLILSMVSLAVTTLLLVVTLFGWYVSNSQASVDTLTGITSGNKDIEIKSFKRYAIRREASGNYGVVKKNGTPFEVNSISDVQAFDTMGAYDRILYVISYVSSKNTVNVSMENTSLTRSDKLTYVQGTDLVYSNYLSNVALINKLSNITLDSEITIPESGWKSVDYSGEADTAVHKVSIGTEAVDDSSEQFIYLLLDYNIRNVNAIYSANLGTDAKLVEFNEDIRFVLM